MMSMLKVFLVLGLVSPGLCDFFDSLSTWLPNPIATDIMNVTIPTLAPNPIINDIVNLTIPTLAPDQVVGDIINATTSILTPNPIFNDIIKPVEDFFNMTELELAQMSKILADLFGLHEYNPLNQSVITDVLNSILSTPTTPQPTPATLNTFVQEVLKVLQNTAICGACQFLVLLFRLHLDLLIPVLQGICDIYIALSTYTVGNFCSGLINLNYPTLKYIRANSTIMDEQLVCSILLQTKECYYPKPALTWVGSVNSGPKILPATVEIDPTKPPLYFLHASDFHVSLNYEVGAVSDCGYPVCCLKGLGNSQLKSGRAGQWGDYNCDASPDVIDNALSFIKNKFPITAIYYTGDVVDHAIWNTTIEQNKKSMDYVFGKFKEYFPDTRVLPALGNHESQPLNVFPPLESDIANAGLDQQWLYTYAAELWSQWVDGPALDTIRLQGFYSYDLYPNLKVIVINNNLCYCYNWWLFYNTTFMQHELDWLQNELLLAETNGQYVHIVGHNSMGNEECISPWEDTFLKLVQRFSHIIQAQFVGHTHTDELKIFYDTDGKPINVAFNGASLTTYTTYNPNFKIVEVSPDTMEILNVHTYYFNLTLANLYPDQSPPWQLLYSMKGQYNLTDLSAASFDKLSDEMANDSDLLRIYWLNYVRYGDAAIKNGCDSNCMKGVLCKITRTQSRKPTKPYCTD